MNDSEADTVVGLMRQIEVLRDALKGRTVSCATCNFIAKQREELCEAVRDFAAQERLFLARSFCRTDVSYGDQRPHLWRKAFRKLCRIVQVLP
jgi:hypothetical protein